MPTIKYFTCPLTVKNKKKNLSEHLELVVRFYTLVMLYIYDGIHFFDTSVTVNDVILWRLCLSVWAANGEISRRCKRRHCSV